MANDNINDTDSGIASSDATPVNKESSTLTPPESTPEMEEVSTPAAAASAEEDEVQKIISAHILSTKAIEDNDSEEDVEDESFVERLLGLSEMFPTKLRSASCTIAGSSVKFIAGSYSLARHAVWFISTTSLLLFAPVLFEVERVNAEEMIKQDRNKLVLGPGTAMSGAPSSPAGMMGGPPSQ